MTRRILLVATSLDTPGGVAAVLRVWRDAGLFERAGVDHIATGAPGRRWHKASTALRAWLRCVAWMLGGRVSLVHVHTSSFISFWRKTPFIAAAMLLRRPLIVSLHGGAFREFFGQRGALGRAWIRLVMRRATRFVVLTEEWRRWVSSLEPAARVRVIPNTVAAVDRPVPAVSDAARRGPLLFLGRVEPAKGIFLLIEALARAHAAGATWSLVCGGTGDIEQARAASAEAGLPAGAIDWRGWVEGRDKAELLRRCEGVVLPSLIENMPVSLLEAYAHGKPVIATRVGGVPDMLTDGNEGLLVEAGQVGPLAAALIAAWHAGPAWRRMGEAAAARFRRDYRSEAVVAQVESLYAECLREAAAVTSSARERVQTK